MKKNNEKNEAVNLMRLNFSSNSLSNEGKLNSNSHVKLIDRFPNWPMTLARVMDLVRHSNYI